MKKKLSILVFSLFFLGIVIQVSAAPVTLINGGFESGDFTNWEFSEAIVEGSTIYGPRFGNGSYYAEITGAGQEADPEFQGESLYRGSIRQSISWEDGDTYDFDWRFLFNDGTQYDYAYYKIGNGAETAFYIQGLTGTSVTDWITETITFSDEGDNVWLEFGVVSYGSNAYSKLLIDAATPVPEPASLILLGVGLLGIAGIRRKI